MLFKHSDLDILGNLFHSLVALLSLHLKLAYTLFSYIITAAMYLMTVEEKLCFFDGRSGGQDP